MKKISNRLKTLIDITWTLYNNNVYNIPKIKEMKILQNESIAGQFLFDDLYNQNYILYLSEEMEVSPDDYVEEILFHEFTHLADSTLFLKYSIKEFKDLMSIYSEIHASEIQMDKILSTIENPSPTLKQVISYKAVTLKKFLDKELKDLKQEFAPLKNKTDAIERCNFVYIYYFIGYLKSLKNHNIKYHHNYKGIIKSLIPEIIKLEKYFLSMDTVNTQEILSLEKDFITAFELYYFSYRIEHL